MTAPTPPQNVRVVLDDGQVLAVECRYHGIDHRGLHLWTTVTPEIPLDRIRAIEADVVPARTGIAIGVQL